MDYVIGVDLGGTHLRAALVDTQGTIVNHVRVPTRASEGAPSVIGRIEELIAQVRAAASGPVLGVGIGSPGPLDPEEGVIVTTPNMPGWEGMPLRSMLERKTGLPVMLGNDANAAALGEWLFGAGKGVQNLVYVTISTGIGGGVIVDGRLLLGRKGLGGEVGHMIIKTDGPRCNCGSIGCWEALASGTALARIARLRLETVKQPSLLRSAVASGSLSAPDIAAAAQRGDPLAKELLEEEGFYIGVGIVNLLHNFSPDVIVLGGGVTNIGEPIFGPMRKVIAERAMHGFRTVPVRQTQLGDQVGVLGAAALVIYGRGTHTMANPVPSS